MTNAKAPSMCLHRPCSLASSEQETARRWRATRSALVPFALDTHQHECRRTRKADCPLPDQSSVRHARICIATQATFPEADPRGHGRYRPEAEPDLFGKRTPRSRAMERPRAISVQGRARDCTAARPTRVITDPCQHRAAFATVLAGLRGSISVGHRPPRALCNPRVGSLPSSSQLGFV